MTFDKINTQGGNGATVGGILVILNGFIVYFIYPAGFAVMIFMGFARK